MYFFSEGMSEIDFIHKGCVLDLGFMSDSLSQGI